MLWGKPTILSDFSLAKSLQAFGCLKHNIIFIYFPKSISFRFDSHYQEIDRNIWPFGDFFIFLHQADNQICLLRYTDSKLRIIEPSIISIILWALVFVLFILLCFYRVRPTCGVSIPFAVNRVLGPGCWEYFAKIYFIEMSNKI